MVDFCPEVSRLEEVDGVQVCHVHAPRVWLWTLGPVLLGLIFVHLGLIFVLLGVKHILVFSFQLHLHSHGFCILMPWTNRPIAEDNQ